MNFAVKRLYRQFAKGELRFRGGAKLHPGAKVWKYTPLYYGLRLESCLDGDTGQVDIVAGVARSEGGKGSFSGAFKNGDTENAVFVKVRDQYRYVKILAHAGAAAGVVPGCGGAGFGVYGGEVESARLVNGEGV